MNKRHLQTIGIGKTTLSLLDSKPTLWNSFPPVVQTVEGTRLYLSTLEQYGRDQAEGNTTGHTQNKEIQKKMMCDLAWNLMRKLRGFARINKKAVLLKAIDFSKTGLNEGAEAEVIQRCQLIHNKGQEYLSQLAGFQVSAELLQTLQTAIKTLEPLPAQRDVVEKTRVTTTANIETLIGQLREDLITLDDLIASMVEEADFVATYQQVRQLPDRGRRKRKPDKPDEDTSKDAPEKE